MATGITAAGGMGRKISSTGDTDCRTHGKMPMMPPRMTPRMLQANQPTNIDATVFVVCSTSRPSVKPSTSFW